MPVIAGCRPFPSLFIIFLLNISSSFSYAVVAGRQVLQPIVIESEDGHIYLPANSAAVTTASQSTTSVLSVQGTAVAAALPVQTSSATQPGQNVSSAANGSPSILPIQTSSGTQLGQSVSGGANGPSNALLAQTSSGSLPGQSVSGAANGPPSATVTPTSSLASNLAGASSSRWPSSITFVSESSGVPFIGIAFITTVGGTSLITNTQPKQSLITPTSSAISQVAITEGNTTTTLKLASLPTASPLPQVSGVQVVSESGSPVIYSPITLSGYSNTGPAEISTDFVEVINGQTTTQGGWWLIGAGGVIDPPKNRPWKGDGDTVGCIGGPLLCNMPWVDIGGGFGIRVPGSSTGPPGYPGGPVDPADEQPEDSPPPYEDADPEDDPDEKKTAEQTTQPHDKKTASEQEISATVSSSQHSATALSRTSTSRMTSLSRTSTSRMTSLSRTSASRMTTFSGNTTMRATSSSPISTSATKAQYFINAAVNASQDKISALLKEFDPDAAGKSYVPDIGATPADGGLWVGYNLTLNQAQNLSRRSDVLMVNTYTDTPLSFNTQTPVAVLSDTDAVTLWTLLSNTTSTQAGLSPSAVCWFFSQSPLLNPILSD